MNRSAGAGSTLPLSVSELTLARKVQANASSPLLPPARCDFIKLSIASLRRGRVVRRDGRGG